MKNKNVSIVLLASVFLMLCGTVSAQQARLLATQEAVAEGKKLQIGSLMDRNLYTRTPSQLQWNSLVNEIGRAHV